MRARLMLATWCLPAFGATVPSCPWLNAATAGGFLGGTVTTATARPAKSGDDVNCDFIRLAGSVTLEIRIETHTMPSPSKDFAAFAAHCRDAAVPLRAIGNEALACSDKAGDGGVAEQVVGRVRERAFRVRISSSDHTAQPDILREKARKIAEQVAGILF